MPGTDVGGSRALLAIAAAIITALLAPTTAGADRIAPAPFEATAAESLVAAAAPPPGFEESAAFSGLTAPMAVRFAPDGRVFVAEKSGLIKTFDGLGDSTPTVFADLRTQVHDFWDRGLTGMELDPNFAVTGRVYVLYARNEEPFSTTMPRWPDGCPTPPGATGDGCVVTGTLSRLDANGTETRLIQKDWCQQYPSHSVGGIAFGADGMLYLSAGDGASFNFPDYGQDGSPVNPCGDPPGGVGGSMTPPTAEGGALRAQDVRTSGDPTGLDGSILRLDPNTGAAAPGNPASGSADANTRRIVAHGLRNPFRITVRPGTNEIWAGDVGWNTWEEINRVANPTGGVTNFGWPCYEGNGRMSSYDNNNLNICENLYAAGASAHAQPYYTYNHGAKVVAGESCPTGGSAIAGLDFYTTGPFPDSYDGALFFADYTRDCIWVMLRGANGLPDPATLQTFVAGAANPVDVQIGPDGALYYANLDGGTIQRVRWPNSGPTARASATPTNGAVPLAVGFDGSTSSDPDPGDVLTYAWDLDGDGAFDDSTAARPNFNYTSAGTYDARLRVTDGAGASDTATVRITAGVPPTATIAAPAAGTTWQVGTVLNFSGSARDAQDNAIPAGGLRWTWNLRHCSRLDPSNCHTHTIQTFNGVASGSFTAPDHEYPSHLELELTATDAAGLTTTVTRRLDPRTVDLTVESVPAGLQLSMGSDSAAGPFTRTVIVGSSNAIAAPSPQTLGGQSYTFSAWSDGGAASHNIVAPAAAATYRATFTAAGGPSGLVAAYGLDEGSGSAVGDASGRGNAGTVGGATWSTSGRFGSALSFDGTNDQVTIPDANSLDLTSGMTLEAWVNPSAGGGWRTVLLKERPGGFAYALYSSGGNGAPSGHVEIGGDRELRGTAALPTNTWTHVATTYDGSMQRLFVNGTQVATRAQTGAIATSTGALKIGGNSVWAEWFAGRIDEVRVYNRALSAAELQADMAAPVGPQPDPVLAVSPASLSFTATAGGGDPAPQELAVAGGAFGFTTASAPSWLTVAPASGSAPGSVTVTPRIAGLAAGTYNGTVTVTAAGVQGSPKQIPVTLRVDPPTTPSGGLVASYGFNAGSGTAVADASGRGNHGTISGASWDAAGRFGSALSFDGTNDMVTVPDASSLDLTTGMTLEAWVNPSAGGSAWRTALLKEHASGLAYALYTSTNTGAPAGWMQVGGDVNADGTAALPTGTWSHLALTYGGGFVRLYVNGVQVASRAQTGSIATSNLPLRIGGNSVWGEWFAGRIDEVRVYDRALSAAEIQGDMAAGV